MLAFMAFISHICQMKITFYEGFFISNFFIIIYVLTLKFSPSRHFKGLDINVGLFWSFLAAKAKFKWPIPCSDTQRLCPINLNWLL